MRLANMIGRALIVLSPLIAFVVVGMASGHVSIGSIGVVLSAAVAWRQEGGGRVGMERLGLSRPDSWPKTLGFAIVIAVAAAIAATVVGLLIPKSWGQPDPSLFLGMRDHPIELLGWLLIAWTTAAFGEELVFRGYLIPALANARANGRPAWALAVAVSTILFGLAHAYQGPTGIVFTGTVGAAFGIAFVIGKRNLWRTVLAHGIFDTASLILLFFSLRGQLK
jgi:membrane protease YdiL (CAAX protease family)